MQIYLWVGLGGFVGAIARYAISNWVYQQSNQNFPYGTLVVNVLGCLFIGMLMSWSSEKLDPTIRLFAVSGLLGSLTTFSTFGYETVLLLDRGEWRAALGNIALNFIVGIVAVYTGRLLAGFITTAGT